MEESLRLLFALGYERFHPSPCYGMSHAGNAMYLPLEVLHTYAALVPLLWVYTKFRGTYERSEDAMPLWALLPPALALGYLCESTCSATL